MLLFTLITFTTCEKPFWKMSDLISCDLGVSLYGSQPHFQLLLQEQPGIEVVLWCFQTKTVQKLREVEVAIIIARSYRTICVGKSDFVMRYFLTFFTTNGDKNMTESITHNIFTEKSY